MPVSGETEGHIRKEEWEWGDFWLPHQLQVFLPNLSAEALEQTERK